MYFRNFTTLFVKYSYLYFSSHSVYGISIPATVTTSKMAALTKRIYSSVFLTSLRPNGRLRIELTLYNTLKSFNILRATRGVRAGTRVKQRAAMLSSQRIRTFITTHQRVQSAKYGAGHLATNCINIPTGTRIISKVPKLLTTNACHVPNKVDELHGVVEMNNATVAIVTDSWLTDSVPSTAISIGQSFNLFRKDRPTPGGGVSAYVHSSIPTMRLENIEASDKDVLWLLHTPSRISRPFSCIFTAALCFPPWKTCTEERELIDHVTECLHNLLIERPSAGITITGDFNHLNPRQLCQRFSLRRLVKMPTCGQDIVDQFLSNMGELYCEAQLLPPLGRSDHQCILFSPLNQQRHRKAISRSVRTFKPDNLRSLELKLNLESWSAVYEASGVDEKVEAFNSIIINSLDTCTPLGRVRLHPSDKEWMTPHIKDHMC